MRKVLIPLILGAFLLVACDISSIPGLPKLEVGELRTKELLVPLGDAESAEVVLRFGAANFHLNSGATELLKGEVTYNVGQLEPETEYSTSAGKARVEISPRRGTEIRGLPTERVRNDWEVWLTKEIPLSLRIEAGAFSGEFDLSGLRLVNLEMRTGAARSTVSFEEPNPQELEKIEIETGASEFDILGLGYANFEEMTFKSSLGRYTLDFTGPLNRSAEVRIETGISQVTIIVPESTGTKVILEEGVSDTDIYGFRRLGEKEYVNDAFQEAENTLVIKVRMGLGSLTLRSE